jgi:hypothetical protein
VNAEMLEGDVRILDVRDEALGYTSRASISYHGTASIFASELE